MISSEAKKKEEILFIYIENKKNKYKYYKKKMIFLKAGRQK